MKSFHKITLFVLFALFASIGYAQTKLTFSTAIAPTMEIYEAFLKQAYQKIDIEVQFKQFPAERALTLSNKGEVDGETARILGLTKLYPNLIPVPVKLISVYASVYSKNKDLKVNGLKSVKSLKVGIGRGDKMAEALTKGMNPQVVNNTAAVFGILKKGRVDIIIGSQSIADAYLRSHPEFSMIHRIDPPVFEIPAFHYLHKKNQHLIPKIKPILEKMIADKVLVKMLEKAKKGK